jgi:hypothetical protein
MWSRLLRGLQIDDMIYLTELVYSSKPSGKHSYNFIQALYWPRFLLIQYATTCFCPYTGHPQVFFVCIGWIISTLRHIQALLFCSMSGDDFIQIKGLFALFYNIKHICGIYSSGQNTLIKMVIHSIMSIGGVT